MARDETCDNGKDRVDFVKAVGEHTAPVLTQKGFTCTDATDYVVRFRSPKVSVELSYEPYSSEIDVNFARLADPSHQFGIADLVEAAAGPGHREEVFFVASTTERLRACLTSISYLLRTYGGLVLAGDPAVYFRMSESARERGKAYEKQEVHARIRKAAEDSWKEHNYARVRDLYSFLGADLTRVEKGRLEYAERHLHGP